MNSPASYDWRGLRVVGITPTFIDAECSHRTIGRRVCSGVDLLPDGVSSFRLWDPRRLFEAADADFPDVSGKVRKQRAFGY